MRDGKRSKAEQVLNKVFQVLDEKYPGRASHIFYFSVFEAKRDIGICLKPKPKPKKRRKINPFDLPSRFIFRLIFWRAASICCPLIYPDCIGISLIVYATSLTRLLGPVLTSR